jgi:hypothetical protein
MAVLLDENKPQNEKESEADRAKIYEESRAQTKARADKLQNINFVLGPFSRVWTLFYNFMLSVGGWQGASWAVIILIVMIPTVLLWIVIYAVGAARLAYITHNSIILAGIAFVISPFYYIYHAFTE